MSFSASDTASAREIIAHHLSRDPNLPDTAAQHIAALARELYTSLARPPHATRIRLRAAPTFKPEASRLLGDLLEDMQRKLTTGSKPGSASK